MKQIPPIAALPVTVLRVAALCALAIFALPTGTSKAAQPTASQPSAAPQQPNILWLITEDMGPELACYGTEQVWTPVLDNLARRGVRYANAFTVTPVCSTSRSGFCTGMVVTAIGAHQHRTADQYKKPLPEGVRPITHWLQDVGYYTANIRTMKGKRFGTGKVDWNFSFQGKAFQGSDWESLKKNQPFYAQVNFSQSHRGWTAPKRADPDKVTIPPYYPDHPLVREDWAQYLDEISEVDGLIGQALQALKDDGTADNTIVFMFGDHGRAHVRGKQWPYDSGLHVPMIVYIPPALGKLKQYKPGTVDQRLIASIDITATTLDLAGVKKPAVMHGRVFLGPHTEADRQYVFASRDRCDMTTFRIRTVRDSQYRYIRNFMPDRPFFNINRYKEQSYPTIALMRQLHQQGKLNEVQDRLFNMTRPAEELYLIGDDPYEINNLVDSGDPKHQLALKRLRSELSDWIDRTNDTGRVMEDPAIGLAEMQTRMKQQTISQLQYFQDVVKSQMASHGISPYYQGYLRKVQKMIDDALPNAPDKPRKRNKKKK